MPANTACGCTCSVERGGDGVPGLRRHGGKGKRDGAEKRSTGEGNVKQYDKRKAEIQGRSRSHRRPVPLPARSTPPPRPATAIIPPHVSDLRVARAYAHTARRERREPSRASLTSTSLISVCARRRRTRKIRTRPLDGIATPRLDPCISASRETPTFRHYASVHSSNHSCRILPPSPEMHSAHGLDESNWYAVYMATVFNAHVDVQWSRTRVDRIPPRCFFSSERLYGSKKVSCIHRPPTYCIRDARAYAHASKKCRMLWTCSLNVHFSIAVSSR